jgi:hypothetical protein
MMNRQKAVSENGMKKPTVSPVGLKKVRKVQRWLRARFRANFDCRPALEGETQLVLGKYCY